MEIEFLRHFGFPVRFINTLQKAYGKRFLPLQEKAVQEGGLFNDNHLLVQAPTSSGKTMLAELLFLYHVQKPKGTLLLVPTKALANQRYRELKERYQPLGFKICLSTRDHPKHDQDIRRGDFHLAVLVYEKLLSLLIDSPTLLNYTGVCVIDEIHYLLDMKRGANLALLLTRIMQEAAIQRLGLSAIHLQDEICDWLKMERLALTERPVELRQGVLCQGKFHYHEFNSKQSGIENIPISETEDDGAAMLEAAAHFYHQGESTLLFFPTRELCYTAARKLAQQISTDDTCSIHALEAIEDSTVKRFLGVLLPKRIAIHTSDLTTKEREVVESLIQKNEIRIIVATSTLAEGINFPVTNVITTKHMYTKNANETGSSLVPVKTALSHDRLQNMTGRAGRLGYQEQGRGMMVTCFEGEIDGLLKQFSCSSCENVSIIHTENLPEKLLKTFALFKTQTIESCYTVLKNTLYFNENMECIKQSVSQLLQHNILGKEQNALYLTGLGHAAAAHGISLTSAQALMELARQSMDRSEMDHCEMDEAVLLSAIMVLPEMQDYYVPVSTAEIRSHIWTKKLYENTNHSIPSGWLHRLFSSPETISPDHHTAFKKTMLCLDWMDGLPIIELENRYRIYAGLLSRITTEAAWLLKTLADILATVSIKQEGIVRIETIRKQLQYGIPENAMDWIQDSRQYQITRSQVLQCLTNGLHSPSQISGQHKELLETILPSKTVMLLLKRSKRKMNPSPPTEPTGLQIDPARPDHVYVQNQTVKLTKMQSDLIRCLNKQIGQCVEYESLMNTLWGYGLGERKSLHRLKNQIIEKCVAAGGAIYKNIIEVVPGVGFVLTSKWVR